MDILAPEKLMCYISVLDEFPVHLFPPVDTDDPAI